MSVARDLAFDAVAPTPPAANPIEIGFFDITASVVGTLIGVFLAAKIQTITMQQVASYFGGTAPSVVDAHISVGSNPRATLNPERDAQCRVGLFQVGTAPDGNPTLTQLYAGPVNWDSTLTVPAITIDPNGGGFALFGGDTDDPITVAFSVPVSTDPGQTTGTPAPGTPGAPQPKAPSPIPGPPKIDPKRIHDALWVAAGVVLLIVGFFLLEAHLTASAARRTLRIAGGA